MRLLSDPVSPPARHSRRSRRLWLLCICASFAGSASFVHQPAAPGTRWTGRVSGGPSQYADQPERVWRQPRRHGGVTMARSEDPQTLQQDTPPLKDSPPSSTWITIMPSAITDLGINLFQATDNSTLIGLLQVAQQAIKPQTLALSFSRQFAKRYLNKWEDKTNIKGMIEQTLADLVRVADSVDVHSNPRVAQYAGRLRDQLAELRRSHDAKAIFFFNEPAHTVQRLPSPPDFPVPTPLIFEGGDSVNPLFGPRAAPAVGSVKKKQDFVRLFKSLLLLSRQTEVEEEQAGLGGKSGVDRLLDQVRQRMEQEAEKEKREEEATVKKGLRLEFELWHELELSRYLSETLAKTKETIDSVGGSAELREVLSRLSPQVQALASDLYAAVSRNLPFRIDSSTVDNVLGTIQIGHRPERLPSASMDWEAALNVLQKQRGVDDPFIKNVNHPLFMHAMLLLATTPYNLRLSTPGPDDEEEQDAMLQRTALTASKALGVHVDDVEVHHVVSDKACATIIILPEQDTTIVCFRGTKDPVDVLTDINFLAAPFTPYGWREEEEVRWEEELRDDREDALRVHGGFKLAFDSIKDEITEILEEDGEMANVVFVGHSMGGALAQLATVYFCELKARLVTFASPAIGNEAFCKLLDCCGRPYGGLRIWNDFDVVPIIAQLVGYKHAGVPVRLEVSRSAKDLFESENVNALRGLIDVLAPHVMFQLGPSTVVFPVLGWDLQSFSSLRGDLASPPFPESITQQPNASVSIGVSP